MCDMTHLYVRLLPLRMAVCAGICYDTCDVTQSYLRHDWFVYATWLIYMCDCCLCIWLFAREFVLIRATWLNHTCNKAHSYVRHDSFICATSAFIYGCLRWNSFWYVRRDSIILATWLIRTCNMTHLYVRLLPLRMAVCAGICYDTCDVTQSYLRHDWFICATWLIHMCLCIWPFTLEYVFLCVIWLNDSFRFAIRRICILSHCVWPLYIAICKMILYIAICKIIGYAKVTYNFTNGYIQYSHYKWKKHKKWRIILQMAIYNFCNEPLCRAMVYTGW